MRRIERALRPPHHCAAIPHLGSQHPKGYFATGNILAGFDNEIYISVEWVEQAARDLKWASPADITAFEDRVADLEREVELLKDQLADADKQLDAVAVLKRYPDWRQEKKPGRPKVAKG